VCFGTLTKVSQCLLLEQDVRMGEEYHGNWCAWHEGDEVE
jgi:hypothetical protein